MPFGGELSIISNSNMYSASKNLTIQVCKMKIKLFWFFIRISRSKSGRVRSSLKNCIRAIIQNVALKTRNLLKEIFERGKQLFTMGRNSFPKSSIFSSEITKTLFEITRKQFKDKKQPSKNWSTLFRNFHLVVYNLQ